MTRPKLFNPDDALDAAVRVFSEHGYAGSSAEMLVTAMGIGRQSLYDTFGGKPRLYVAAVQRYASGELACNAGALQQGATPLAGLDLMIQGIVNRAGIPCLGVMCVSELGTSHGEAAKAVAVVKAAHRAFSSILSDHIGRGQSLHGEFAGTSPAAAAEFLISSIAGIRIAARGGAKRAMLADLARLTLRALA